MERRNNSVTVLLFLGALCILFVSCGSETTLQRYDFEAEYNKAIQKSKNETPEQKKEDEKSISDIIRSNSNYRYSPVGKRDPFRSYFGDVKAFNRKKEPVSELQKYNVSDMTVNAIVWGITAPRAVIKAPDGKSYKIQKGDFIGKNWGKVSKILPDKIEIIETYKDPLGRKIINKLYLELPVESLKKKTNVFIDDGEDDE